MSLLNDVSDTALWVAVYRAIESERPDALFKDPLAKRLAGERGFNIAAKMSGARYTAWSVVIRTRIIDDYIQRLVAEGVDTVINLGAGLDTRPYRMQLPPSLRWIEVDYPHMTQLKEEKLAGEKPGCILERMGLDLADLKARENFFAATAARSRRALILTEGVTPYLTNDQVALLAQDLRLHASFCHWILDRIAPEAIQHLRSKRRLRQMQNAPFQFTPPDWSQFFLAQGWKERETRFIAVESMALGRSVPLPWWAAVLRAVIPAKYHKDFRKFYGFALLEPA